MKDLLDECRLQLEYLNGKFGETGTTNSLLSRISTALSEREQPVKDGFEAKLLTLINVAEKNIVLFKENNFKDAVISCEAHLAAFKDALAEYSRLSPCKEKWISDGEIESAIKAKLELYGKEHGNDYIDDNGVYPVIIEAVRQFIPSPPTGDNKKGED